MKKWLIVLLVLFVLGLTGAGLVYKYIYNKPHRNFEMAKPDFVLPAKELFESYRNMRKDAEQKFNGKVLDISGKLKSVEVSDSLVIVVFTFAEGLFGDEGIRCTMLPKYNAEAEDLSPDAAIEIKGYCTGYNDTDVILEKCSLIK